MQAANCTQACCIAQTLAFFQNVMLQPQRIHFKKKIASFQNVGPRGVADLLISRQPVFFYSRAAQRCCCAVASRSEPEVHRGSPALQFAREFWHRWFLRRIVSCSARVDRTWLRGVAARPRATALVVAGGGAGRCLSWAAARGSRRNPIIKILRTPGQTR